MKKNCNFVVAIFLLFTVICFGANSGCRWGPRDDSSPSSHEDRLDKLMIHFIIDKGCSYLSGYIQSNYHGRDSHERITGCDWKSWINHRSHELHVPAHLSQALVDCGQKYSLSTLQAPGMAPQCYTNETLSNTFHNLIGRALVARVFEHGDTGIDKMTWLLKTSSVREDADDDDGDDDEENPNGATSAMRGQTSTSSSLSSTTSPRCCQLARWCRNYSRRVSNKYHPRPVRENPNTQLWLVDIYDAAATQGIPLRYAHALVGCGMKYAYSAFNDQTHHPTVRQYVT